MRGEVLLLAICIVSAFGGSHLPFKDVSEWPSDKISNLLLSVDQADEGNWWVQIGSHIFSPSFSTSFHKKDINSFKLVHTMIPEATLPESLEKATVASVPDLKAFIVPSAVLDTIDQDEMNSWRVIPLKAGLKLFAPQPAAHSSELDLEEDDEEEEKAIKTITNEMYMDELNRLVNLGSGPKHQRNIETEGHVTAQKYLACSMKQAGLKVQLMPFDVSGNKAYNIIGCRGGTESKEFLVVGAHFDTLPGPPARSEGALDNGSGVAVVTSSMNALKSATFRKGVCFVGFDGEEAGCLGSTEMAQKISDTKVLKNNFLGAITSDEATGFVDSVGGSSDTPGWTLENSQPVEGSKSPHSFEEEGIHIDGDPNSAKLIEKVAQRAHKYAKDSMPILTSTVEIWRSDQRPFHRKGLPALDVCAMKHRLYKFYHDNRNTTANIIPDVGRRISQATAGAVVDIAEIVSMDPRSLEENSDIIENIPHFPGSHSMEEVFGDECDCEKVMSSVYPAITPDSDEDGGEEDNEGTPVSNTSARPQAAAPGPVHHLIPHAKKLWADKMKANYKKMKASIKLSPGQEKVNSLLVDLRSLVNNLENSKKK